MPRGQLVISPGLVGNLFARDLVMLIVSLRAVLTRGRPAPQAGLLIGSPCFAEAGRYFQPFKVIAVGITTWRACAPPSPVCIHAASPRPAHPDSRPSPVRRVIAIGAGAGAPNYGFFIFCRFLARTRARPPSDPSQGAALPPCWLTSRVPRSKTLRLKTPRNSNLVSHRPPLARRPSSPSPPRTSTTSPRPARRPAGSPSSS